METVCERANVLPIRTRAVRDLVERLVDDGCTLDEVLVAVEREWLILEVAKVRGSQIRAAANMGIHRNTFARMLHRCGLEITWKHRGAEPRRVIFHGENRSHA